MQQQHLQQTQDQDRQDEFEDQPPPKDRSRKHNMEMLLMNDDEVSVFVLWLSKRPGKAGRV